MPTLTASPFHPLTNALLPVYREAYLMGDLVPESTEAVTRYLCQQPAEAALATARWQELRASGELAGATTAPWEEAKKIVVSSSAGARRFRMPALRMFALLGGLTLTGLSVYGLDLVQQQEQADAAGPVARRTEHTMEAASIAKTEAALLAQSR